MGPWDTRCHYNRSQGQSGTLMASQRGQGTPIVAGTICLLLMHYESKREADIIIRRGWSTHPPSDYTDGLPALPLHHDEIRTRASTHKRPLANQRYLPPHQKHSPRIPTNRAKVNEMLIEQNGSMPKEIVDWKKMIVNLANQMN